ncbi:MAG: helix-turn-helix domain-containing protein [Tannerella sp.]|jgi:AraC-like DNA-binding protein|nr:helix-turn-helix domain-containing protein [Tannerella sp.]
MEVKITPLNWRKYVTNKDSVTAVNNDFMLVENLHLLPVFDFPFKVDMAVLAICTQGVARYRVNFKHYESKAPCINILLHNQTLQKEYGSDDFQGYAIVASKQFIDSLLHDMRRREIMLQAVENPVIPLSGDELNMFVSYYKNIKRIIELSNTPYLLETLKHLTLAFIYGTNFHDNLLLENTAASPQQMFTNRFMALVRENFKRERQMSFYAGKLCLTPKYLSLKIRAITGKSAADWIDDYVMLEAKALLKSTNMTIQQISDELNFTSQSFFGKYFKRYEGMSPKEYREG